MQKQSNASSEETKPAQRGPVLDPNCAHNSISAMVTGLPGRRVELMVCANCGGVTEGWKVTGV